MEKNEMKIGIALSGGGVRAAVFHLGVLKRMAETGLWDQISFLSTVSGGSLAAGLIFSRNGNQWPTSQQYLDRILPEIHELLIRKDLQLRSVFRLFMKPWYIRAKANIVEESIRKDWGVTGSLQELSDHPRWIINATCYETGKNWRFMKKRMGDYISGYVMIPDIPISVAMACSAAFPVLIGAFRMKTKPYIWSKYSKDRQDKQGLPILNTIHLWDGGLYENLGIESLLKGDEPRDGVNFIIVSDASGTLEVEKRVSFMVKNQLARLMNIAVDQVRSVRIRKFMDFLTQKEGRGLCLKIGNSAGYIGKNAKLSSDVIRQMESECLNANEVLKASRYKTTLSKMTEEDFCLILRHGYEVMKCTYEGYIN